MPILLFLDAGETELLIGTFDGRAAVTGPASIGPTPSGTTLLEIGTFDGRTTPSGPVLIRKTLPPGPVAPTAGNIPAIVTPPRQTYGILLEPDDVTVVSQLVNQQNLQWRDGMNETGGGSIQVPYGDGDAALLTPGRLIRCFYEGVAAFTFQIEGQPRRLPIDQGEESSEVVQVSGRGWAATFDGATVYPVDGLTSPLNPQQRLFSFASPDYPSATDFGPVHVINQANVINPERAAIVEVRTIAPGEEPVSEFVLQPAPLGWPVDEAFWIWGQADTSVVGRNYFRTEFTLPGRANLQIIATADNLYTLFLQGIPLIGENANEAAWQEFKGTNFALPAGTYTLAAIGENIPWPEDLLNPAGFLCAVITPSADEENPVAEVWAVSDGSWSGLAYPVEPPGWTPGEVLHTLTGEAQARSALAGVTLGFGPLTDSSGNSWRARGAVTAWSYMSGYATPVGESMLRSLELLVDQGWIDWRMKPGARVLEVWSQGRGGGTGGTFADGVNILSQDFAESERIINRVTIKWPGGYTSVQDDASIAAIGVVEGFATVDAPSRREAQRLGRVLLEDSVDANQAIIMSIVPTSDDTTPYIGFSVGDYITCPTAIGVPHQARVVAITVDQGDLEPTVALELNRKWQTREALQEELIESLGSGVTGMPGSKAVVTINPLRDQLQV